MPRHGKSYVWQDYLTAFNLIWGKAEFSYSETTQPDEERDFEGYSKNTYTCRPIPSPENIEEKVIKREAVNLLSQEAKEIIKLILQSPEEVTNLLKTPKYDIISKEKIYRFLKVKGWKGKTIEKTFGELKDFVSGFD